MEIPGNNPKTLSQSACAQLFGYDASISRNLSIYLMSDLYLFGYAIFNRFSYVSADKNGRQMLAFQ